MRPFCPFALLARKRKLGSNADRRRATTLVCLAGQTVRLVSHKRLPATRRCHPRHPAVCSRAGWMSRGRRSRRIPSTWLRLLACGNNAARRIDSLTDFAREEGTRSSEGARERGSEGASERARELASEKGESVTVVVLHVFVVCTYYCLVIVSMRDYKNVISI
jgi:hypothetical protein